VSRIVTRAIESEPCIVHLGAIFVTVEVLN